MPDGIDVTVEMESMMQPQIRPSLLSPVNRRHFLVLVGLMLMLALAVGTVASISMYSAAFNQYRQNLSAVAKAHAGLIEAVAQHAAQHHEDPVEGVLPATLAVLAGLPQRFEGLGATGEIILARREGDRIHRLAFWSGGAVLLGALPTDHTMGGSRAVPMQRALAGQAGTVVASDYRGVTVLAAYQPLAALQAGVVAKLDLSEVRRPLVRAAYASAVVSAFFVLLGIAAFMRRAAPMVERIEASEARLRAVVDHASEGVITVDGHGRIIDFNRAAEAMFQLPARVAVGGRLADLLPSLRAVLSGATGRVEMDARRRDGTAFPLALSISETRVAGQTLYTAILNDITEQRSAETAMLQAQAELESRVEARTEELCEANRLLQAMADVQNTFLASRNPQSAFEHMLHNLLALTGSPIGMLAADGPNPDGPVCYLAVWDVMAEPGRRTERVPLETGLDRRADAGTAVGGVLRIPLYHGSHRVGTALVANRESDYSPALVKAVEPFLRVCGTILHELRLREQTERARAEAFAAQRELSGILHHIQDTVFRTDLEGHLTWVSPSVTLLSGRNPEALMGQPLTANLVDGLPFSTLRQQLDLGGGQLRDIETRVVTASGDVRWISTNCQYFRDEDGHLSGVEGVSRDVSAYKRAQAQIRRLNQLYSMLSHANRAMVQLESKAALYRELCRVIVTIGGFRMVWIGEVGADRRTVTPVHSDGSDGDYMHYLHDIPLDDSPGGSGPVAVALKQGQVVVVNDVANDPRMAPWRDAALARGYRALAIFPFRRAGEPFGALNVYMGEAGYFSADHVELLECLAGDISHALEVLDGADRQREATEQLRNLSAKLSSHIENTPLAVIEHDPQGRVVAWNPAAEAMFGYTTEAMVGQSIERIIAPDRREWVADAIEAIMNQAGESKYVNDNITRDGRRITCEWYVTVLQDAAGRPDGVMALAHDVTDVVKFQREVTRLNAGLEQRVAIRTRELEAVNHELEAFSYSVSHDLRAPLRSVDGFSQLLLRRYGDRLDETGRDYLQRVRRATQRMGTLIDDLLRLSRISRSGLDRKPIDLGALAAEVMAELHQTAPERRFAFAVDEGIPTASADRHLMRIVLENLLGNAWKFTRNRDRPQAWFRCTERDGKTVFEVGDNGAGFEMQYADKLFGAFQRLHGEDEFEGTGIGLATVQRIIHRHGGRIWAQAAPEQGARFFFTLGCVDATETEKNEKPTADIAG